MDSPEKPSEENQSPKPLESTRRWASASEIGQLLRTQWPKYLVDIIVIILGITISFTFDSRKEEANRAATEQVYLKSLLADIDSDIEELDNVIDKTQEVINAADDLLKLTDHNGEEVTNLGFTHNIKIVMRRPNFVSKDATFSDLRSSGNMQLIENIPLKGTLFAYYRLYEQNKAVETSEREVANSLIADYLLKHYSIKFFGTNNGQIVRPGYELNKLITDAEFSNIITLRKLNRIELLDGYDEAHKLATKIKEELKSLIH